MFFRTLHGRLCLILAALFFALGAVLLPLFVRTSDVYQDEITQRLNRDLATWIVDHEVIVDERGEIEPGAVKHLFHMLMVINPKLELYVLDAKGRVTQHLAPQGRLIRRQVALEPVEMMLAGDARLPLYGDDPRSASAKRVFTVAPLSNGGEVVGYLYAILASREEGNVGDQLRMSYILRLGLGLTLGAMVFFVMVGFVGFSWLTRPLRELERRMRGFAGPGPTLAADAITLRSGDEIDSLQRSFDVLVAEVDRQMKELESVDARRRDFVADVSHDLRTPLTTLRGYIDTIIVEREGEPRAPVDDYLDRAVRSCRTLERMVGDLFDLSKLASPGFIPSMESFSLVELAQDVVQDFEREAARRAVALEVDLGSQPASIDGDVRLIQRVVVNLVENALQHVRGGGRVVVGVGHDGDDVVVTVTDDGCGIDPEEIDRIFERFHRASTAPGRSGDGSGLGLYVARRIVEAHEGRLEVESVPGEGSRFRVRLPAAQVPHRSGV